MPAYMNLYGQALWQAAINPLYGYAGAYNLGYADQCNLSTTIVDPGIQSLSVTIYKN